MSDLEDRLAYSLKRAKVPTPVQEYRFHPVRRWRVDFAFVEQKVAVEVEGGSWVGGRHSRGAGFEADCEKYGELAAMGWRTVRVTGAMIKDGRALALIKRVLAA